MRDIFFEEFLKIVNSSLKLYELYESCDACLINSHISADKNCSWGLIRCQNISDVYLFDKQSPWFQLFYFICQMVVIEKGKLFIVVSNITSKKYVYKDKILCVLSKSIYKLCRSDRIFILVQYSNPLTSDNNT